MLLLWGYAATTAHENGVSPMSKPIRVGTYTLLEPTEFQTLYECASWYQRVRVPAGTYEVLAYPHSLAESDVGNMLYVQAEGQVTDDHEGRAPAGQTARASIHLNTYWPGGADAGPK